MLTSKRGILLLILLIDSIFVGNEIVQSHKTVHSLNDKEKDTFKNIHLSIHLDISTDELREKNHKWITLPNDSEKRFKYITWLNESETARIHAANGYESSRSLLRSMGNGTKEPIGELNTTVIIHLISNGANDLKDLMSKAERTFIDPTLEKMEEALKTIKHDFGTGEESKEARENIEDALGDLTDAKHKMFYLKCNLDLLANGTIKNADRVLKRIKRYQKDAKKDMSEKQKERSEYRLKKILKKMIYLIDNSENILKEALHDYEKVQKSLNIVASRVRKYKGVVESYLSNEDGKLDKWVNDLRAGAYGGASACLIVFVLCPIVYAATATGVEVSINSAKNQLSKQKDDANTAIEIVANVIKQVELGNQFIHNEYPLIKNWASEIDNLKTELDSPNMILASVKEEDIEEIEELEEALNGLKEACTNYLLHSVDKLFNKTMTTKNIDAATKKSLARVLLERNLCGEI